MLVVPGLSYSRHNSDQNVDRVPGLAHGLIGVPAEGPIQWLISEGELDEVVIDAPQLRFDPGPRMMSYKWGQRLLALASREASPVQKVEALVSQCRCISDVM